MILVAFDNMFKDMDAGCTLAGIKIAHFQRKVCRFPEACINCLLLTATLFLGPLVVQPKGEVRCVVVANHMQKWM